MVRTMKYTLAVVLLCLLVPVGCADEAGEVPTCADPDVSRSPRPDVPLRRQTPHLDIHSEGFVCAGTAVELERHADFVSSQFDIDLRAHIPVYLYENSAEPCSSRAGCVARDGAVFTTPYATYHQLGRSVACELRRGAWPTMLFGVAAMFEPTPETYLPSAEKGLLGLIEPANEKWSDHQSGHFVRWLYEREGGDAVAELYRRSADGASMVEAIEDIYGASLEQLETEYFADAPYRYVPFRQCSDLPHVERDDGGVWRHSSIIDCESESTMGPYMTEDFLSSFYAPAWNLMFQSFTFSVEKETPIDYDLQGDIERVLLWRCGDEHPSSSGEEQDEFVDWSLRPKDWVGNQSRPTLSPGTWRADVLVVHGPAAPIGVAMWEVPPHELP
jgi:hypothetical protein